MQPRRTHDTKQAMTTTQTQTQQRHSHSHQITTFLVLRYLFGITAAFTPMQRMKRASLSFHSAPFRVGLTSRLASQNDDEGDSFFARNVLRTSVKHFLTQRSVQSFMYLAAEVRDPHTVRWLDKFGHTNDLLQFHGTGALNASIFNNWDTYLMEMMDQPVDVVVVQARRRGRGRGGFSENNPYMEDRIVEFEIEIDPPSLASRILSVREQLAREWAEDLDIVIRNGDDIMNSYFQNVLNERDNEDISERNGPDVPDNNDDGGKGGDGAQDDSISYSEISESGGDVEEISTSARTPSKTASFDRNSMMDLRNKIAFNEISSSPLRNKNFDLLLLLSTQESIHRVLRDYQAAGAKTAVMYEWLRNFYVERAAAFFDGPQKLGRAEDFIEELILTPPSVVKEGGKMSIIDPLGLVEKVIRKRVEVASEWKDLVTEVPEDHIALRKKLFAQQMEKTVLGADEEPVEVESVKASEENEMGEFE